MTSESFHLKRKICIVSGTRADYGLLYWLMKEIGDDDDFILQIIVTGMHLSPEFGLTYRSIEEDGFQIDAKIETILSSDTPVGVAKAMGLGAIGFAEAFDRMRPDILVLLGDRFEMFAAAQAALVARIPIAHIAGGDSTEGAFDEAIRHSITKMSHLHFVTNEKSHRRVLQLGEQPEYVFNVGSLGIDQIKRLQFRTKEDIEKDLGFRFKERNLLVTFHPVTLDGQPGETQFHELLAALSTLGPDVGIIFTKPNADPGGRVLIAMIDDFVACHTNASAFSSLGQLNYLSVMRYADAVVGNSSSGIYEAPSFGKPTVNIGDRQKGRIMATSIINCVPQRDAILKAIEDAFRLHCADVVNPYGEGESSSKVLAVLKRIPDFESLLKKSFFDYEM